MWIVYEDLASSQVSEGLTLPSCPTSEQSPTVRSIDTARVFYCHECDQVTLIEPLSGTMLHPCKEEHWDPSKLYSAGSHNHAKTSAWRAAEKAWAASVQAFFSRSSGSRANYDLDSSSWRTSQQLLFEEQSELLGSFAASGMTVDGAFYPLRMWERITDAKDGGYWRTPDTGAGGTSGQLKAGKTHRKSGAAITMRLVDQVNNPPLWPTPRAGNPGSRPNKKGGKILAEEVKKSMWRTPNATDGKNRGTAEYREGKQIQLQTQVGGSLNPTWVEWLMGFPLGWTDLT